MIFTSQLPYIFLPPNPPFLRGAAIRVGFKTPFKGQGVKIGEINGKN
jgi:hypothetical protein